MSTLQIDIDDEELRRAEAFAAIKGRPLAQFLSRFIAMLGEDVVTIRMPNSARTPLIHMLRHDGNDQVANFFAKGTWREFEQPMPEIFYATIGAFPGAVTDIGCGTGFYTLLAAQSLGCGPILAFEVDPTAQRLFAMNVALNGLTDRVHLDTVAVSDTIGTAPLYVPTPHRGLVETSSSLEPKFKYRHSHVTEVGTTTLDHYLTTMSTPPGPISVMKIDVEGHERAVLDGAAETVARDRPLLFIEVLDASDRAEISRFITRLGYLDVPLSFEEGYAPQAAVTFEPKAWNHALVPTEKLARFLQLIARDVL